MDDEPIRITADSTEVGGLWRNASPARSTLVVAHGAGGNMHSPLLAGFADSLEQAGIATLRFNFAYSEAGRRTPDRMPILFAAYRAAFGEATRRSRGKPVFVGGKSLGGRVASMLVADGLPASGVVFIGYPLHPPGKPEQLRDEHLSRVRVPMLFLQGTSDPFARFDLVKAVTDRLGRWAGLHAVEGADHSFRVKGEKRDDAETGRLLGSVAARFLHGVLI